MLCFKKLREAFILEAKFQVNQIFLSIGNHPNQCDVLNAPQKRQNLTTTTNMMS